MPHITRPDGATIRYEVYGSGHPLLLIAPGGVSSAVEVWGRSIIKPIESFADDFMVIAMDQRHAGQSLGQLRPFSYAQCNADQLAVLDAVDVPSAHVYGGCIGCAHIWSLLSNANGRISAAVCQDPVGLDATNDIGTFYAMFNETMRVARADGVEAVVNAAQDNSLFMLNNAAGPFAPLLHASAEARAEVIDMGRERYIQLIVEFRDGVWPNNPPYFTATDEWFKANTTPILILPGRDQFHPTGVSHRICEIAPAATCLPVECREPENLAATIESIRAFLKQTRRDKPLPGRSRPGQPRPDGSAPVLPRPPP